MPGNIGNRAAELAGKDFNGSQSLGQNVEDFHLDRTGQGLADASVMAVELGVKFTDLRIHLTYLIN
jgi:hypothetical protein